MVIQGFRPGRVLDSIVTSGGWQPSGHFQGDLSRVWRAATHQSSKSRPETTNSELASGKRLVLVLPLNLTIVRLGDSLYATPMWTILEQSASLG